MSDYLPISDFHRPASRPSPREAAHRQGQHRIFERLRKRSERGRGAENRLLGGFSTASLGGLGRYARTLGKSSRFCPCLDTLDTAASCRVRGEQSVAAASCIPRGAKLSRGASAPVQEER